MNKIDQSTKRQGKLKFSDIKRVWKILPVERKPQAIALLFMMAAGMVLETLGVGLVLPIIAVLTDSGLTIKYPVVKEFMGWLGKPSQPAMMMGAMLFLVAVYFIKNLYLALLAWKQSNFVFGTQAEMAKRLFRSYLYQPYTFHLQRNSAELISNLQVELNLFIIYMLSPGMMLIAEGMVVLGLVGALLYFEPIGSFAVLGAFVLAGGLFQWLTRQRIAYWGKQRQLNEGLRMKHAQEGLGAIKDVKIFGAEGFFLKQYADKTALSLRMHQRNAFLHSLTRLWLEILAICGIAILFAVMLAKGDSVGEIMPVLGLFGAASFRLIPSFSRIVGAIQQLRFGVAVTDLMVREFDNGKDFKHENQIQDLSFSNRIVLNNISFQYPGADNVSLEGINLTIHKQEMIGFVGVSGSGKSTLIDVILGLLEPRSGQVSVDGRDIRENVGSWQKQIGYVPQAIYLTDDSLRRNIAFGVEDNEIDEVAVNRSVLAAQLQQLVNDLPEGLDTMLGERGVRLSGGQRQRIGIARALYHDPEILVLDEATSALDTETESEVLDAVLGLQGQKTLLIIAHRLSTVEACDILVELKNGRIVNSTANSKNYV